MSVTSEESVHAYSDAGMTLSVHTKRILIALEQSPEVLPFDTVVSDPVTVHHLVTVCRASVGMPLIVVDITARQVYDAEIITVEKRAIGLRLNTVRPQQTSTMPPVTLAVALIKEQRWDLLLQKCTELGVSEIQPILSDRTIIKLKPDDFARKAERWQAVLRSATEQSEGLFVPQLLPPLSLTEYLKTRHTPGEQKIGTDSVASHTIVLLERGADRPSLKTALRQRLDAQAPLHVLIGPEGGWSDTEIRQFLSHPLQATSLGDRILRSETAAMAAIAAILYETAEG